MHRWLLSFFLAALSLSTYAQSRPNIILFLVDDMGWADTSVPFADSLVARNHLFHTPQMERLADAGMKFTQAYATPVCTPTRVSLMTGLNAAHHGVTNWTSPLKNNNTDNPDEQFNPAPWRINGLSPIPGIPGTIHATTLPALLRDAGYYTIHAGKAHWGAAGTPGANPYNLGFMVNIAGHAAGHPQSYLGAENFGNLPGIATPQAVPDMEEYFGSDVFLTEALTLEAMKALRTPITRKQPFFLHLAHYAVHVPLQPDQRFVQRYLDAGMDKPAAYYAALIEGMDKSLGDLMDFLAASGLAENTVILFLSDNGGLSLAPPMSGSAHSQNLPLRAGKGSLYEGGIRIPMLLRWPGVTRPGSQTTRPVMPEDIFPSLLEIAGIRHPIIQQSLDGEAFVSAARHPDQPWPERTLIWHYPNKWIGKDGPAINYHSAIRRGRWKLVYDQRTEQAALFDLEQDPGEQHNVASLFPDQAYALIEQLGSQLAAWNAPMPISKSTGQTVPYPGKK